MGAWSWGGVIRGCNAFLENYMRSPASANDKRHYAGEIYFFKAWDYFNKMKRFGDLPGMTRCWIKTIRTFTRKGIHASHNRLHTDVPGQGNRVPAQADRCV